MIVSAATHSCRCLLDLLWCRYRFCPLHWRIDMPFPRGLVVELDLRVRWACRPILRAVRSWEWHLSWKLSSELLLSWMKFRLLPLHRLSLLRLVRLLPFYQSSLFRLLCQCRFPLCGVQHRQSCFMLFVTSLLTIHMSFDFRHKPRSSTSGNLLHYLYRTLPASPSCLSLWCDCLSMLMLVHSLGP